MVGERSACRGGERAKKTLVLLDLQSTDDVKSERVPTWPASVEPVCPQPHPRQQMEIRDKEGATSFDRSHVEMDDIDACS